MNQPSRSSTSNQTFDQIADEYVARIRSGEHPSVQEYRNRYPEFSDEIDELFPTLAELEDYDPIEKSGPKTVLDHFEAPLKLGEYTIRRELGRGGMGIVYEAEHGTMRRRVALKVLPASIQTAEYRQRFLREARAAGQLHHTNIVPVFEVGESCGLSFYAMQYIHGQNLDVVIEELKQMERQSSQPTANPPSGNASAATVANSGTVRKPPGDELNPGCIEPDQDAPGNDRRPAGGDAYRGDPLAITEANPTRTNAPAERRADRDPPNPSGSSRWTQVGGAEESYYRRVARVGIQIADALQYAHDHGVLHRDIKPSNLILDTDGVVWITDFGLAKDGGADLTHTGDIVGTLRYMAPERFTGDADVRSEVYSLGLTLYELCTLRHAFDQPDRAQLVQQVTTHDPVAPRRIRADIPLDLETVIVKSIAREPGGRYASAGQMAADLRRFLADRPVHARRVTLAEKCYRWGRRNPWRAAVFSCLVAICMLVTGGSMYFADLQGRHAMELRNENARVVEERRKTEQEKIKVESALKAREMALRASRAHLYYSHLNHGLALQLTGGQGQNFESLSFIRQAAGIVGELDLTPEQIERRFVQLRQATIGAISRLDVRSVKSWKTKGPWNGSVAFDFEHDRLARSDRQGEIEIRSFGVTESESTLPAPPEHVPFWVPRFSPDGQVFAARYHDELTLAKPFVQLWDMDQQRLVRRIDQVSLDAVHCFSSDSDLFALTMPNNTLEIYSTRTGDLKFRMQTPDRPNAIHFARQDTQLIVWQTGHDSVDFWSLEETPTVVQSVPVEEDVAVSALDWMESHEQLAIANGREILVWRPHGLADEPIRLTGHGSRVVRLAIHPSSKMLMSSAWDGTTRLYDLDSGTQAVRIEGHGLTFGGFDDDGRRIGYSGKANEFGIWELPLERPVQTVSVTDGGRPREQIRFVPGHPELIACATDQGVEFWDHPNQTLVATITSGNTRALQFDQHGTAMFTGGDQGLIRWNLSVGNSEDGGTAIEVDAPSIITATPTSLFDYHQDKQLLVAKTAGDDVKIFNLNDNSVVRTGRHFRMSQPAISGDGRYVVTSTWHGKGIKVWNARSGEFVTDLWPDASSASLSVDRVRNRITVVSGYRRTEFSLDDLSKIQDRVRDVPDGMHGGVSYSPDGKWLVAIHSRYVAKLVDATSGNTLTLLDSPRQSLLEDMSWSDDGQFFAIANPHSVQVWDLSQIRRRLCELQIDWQD